VGDIGGITKRFLGASQFCTEARLPSPPLSQTWERGEMVIVPLLPYMGEGVRGASALGGFADLKHLA
jgi:hypothetical protein